MLNHGSSQIYYNTGAPTLTIESGVTIEGRGYVGSTTGFVVNQGIVRSNVSSATMYLYNCTNEGILEASNGADLATYASWTNDGEIHIASDSSLNATSGYTQTADGDLYVELAGLAQYSQVHVTGTPSFDGSFRIIVVNPFDPAPGDMFDVITYALHNGEFSTVTGTNLGDGDTITLDYTDPDLTLDVN